MQSALITFPTLLKQSTSQKLGHTNLQRWWFNDMALVWYKDPKFKLVGEEVKALPCLLPWGLTWRYYQQYFQLRPHGKRHKPWYWVPWLSSMNQQKNVQYPTWAGLSFSIHMSCMYVDGCCVLQSAKMQCKASRFRVTSLKVRLDFLLWGLLIWKMLFCDFLQWWWKMQWKGALNFP